jgi:beta-xylosidase
MRPLRLAPAAALRLAAAAAAAHSETDRNAAPAPTYFTNPVLAHDFPDPTVLRGSDGVFYVYATMGGGHHIQVASSPDLVAWQYHGEALEPPAWMGSASWAPDVTLHGGLYFMYFGAMQQSSGVMCIAVATSASPLGPFRDMARRGRSITTVCARLTYRKWAGRGLPRLTNTRGVRSGWCAA